MKSPGDNDNTLALFTVKALSNFMGKSAHAKTQGKPNRPNLGWCKLTRTR